MRKEDNEWEIDFPEDEFNDSELKWCELLINETRYFVKEDKAALIHSILLLVDAINDKKV